MWVRRLHKHESHLPVRVLPYINFITLNMNINRRVIVNNKKIYVLHCINIFDVIDLTQSRCKRNYIHEVFVKCLMGKAFLYEVLLQPDNPVVMQMCKYNFPSKASCTTCVSKLSISTSVWIVMTWWVRAYPGLVDLKLRIELRGTSVPHSDTERLLTAI